MPLHVVNLGPLGPLISVGIGVGFAFAARGFGGPPGTYNGLIDTGSMRTAISPSVHAAVQCQQVGQFPVNRPGQKAALVPSFDIRLRFEGHLGQYPWFDAEALLIRPATPGVDVIIGQDVLSRLCMVYNGPVGKSIIMY